MRLSPLDPLHYAMRATRAFTHMALGEDVEAGIGLIGLHVPREHMF
jgi:hypothetical protein